MAAVLEMNLQPIKPLDIQVRTCHSQGDCGSGDGDTEVQDEKSEKTKNDCALQLGDMPMAKEVKIDIEEANTSVELVGIKKQVALPLHVSSTVDVTRPMSVEFSEEKDAPEVSTRVYDFNMVKQKTLPRINFGSNGVFHTLFSSHSKRYILVWTLMPLSLVVCIIILILYFMLQ